MAALANPVTRNDRKKIVRPGASFTVIVTSEYWTR
jgi:hypothetical protein